MRQYDIISSLVYQVTQSPEQIDEFLNAACHFHLEVSPKYICSGCGYCFCLKCVKLFGSSAAICKMCGDLCLSYADVREKLLRLTEQNENFGRADVKFALTYPFREAVTIFPLSLIYGASLFSLPFFALYGVGILLGAIGLFAAFLGNAFMFACLSLTIIQIEEGWNKDRIELDIAPLLEDVFNVMSRGISLLAATGWPYLLLFEIKSHHSMVPWLAIGWAIFYYPLALLVSSVTESFWHTINPVTALRMMFEMGSNYLKLFVFYLSIVAIAGVVVLKLTQALLSFGFSLPLYLTIGVFVGIPIFYANLVIACLLGRALLKSGQDL